MQQITEYKVIMAQSPSQLTKEVNEHIADGWVPTGGIAITQSPVTSNMGGGYVGVQTYSHQAMVKLKAD